MQALLLLHLHHRTCKSFFFFEVILLKRFYDWIIFPRRSLQFFYAFQDLPASRRRSSGDSGKSPLFCPDNLEKDRETDTQLPHEQKCKSSRQRQSIEAFSFLCVRQSVCDVNLEHNKNRKCA